MIPKVIKKVEKKVVPKVVVLKREVESTGIQRESPKNPVKSRGKEASLRTKKAVQLLVENGGNKGKALKDAGFSKAVQKNPDKVFGSQAAKAEIAPILDAMIAHRDSVLRLMKTKVRSANYGTLSMALRNLTHDIQLLGGKATDRIDLPVSEEERERLNKLLNKNK